MSPPPSFAYLPSQTSHLSITPTSFSSANSQKDHNNSTVDNVYQVDYTSVNAGKTLGLTKRRVRFRFGFANKDAILKDGKSGSECRGEEHDIIINWSLTSGKQQILCDGHEIHYEVKPRETNLVCTWRFRGSHVLKVVGYAKPSSMRKAGSKQFDIYLDGRSFFDFLPIYALGATVVKEKNQFKHSQVVHRGRIHIDTSKNGYSFYNAQSQPTGTTPSTVASSQSFESDESRVLMNDKDNQLQQQPSTTEDLLDILEEDGNLATQYYSTVTDPFSHPSHTFEAEGGGGRGAHDPEHERRSKLAQINNDILSAIDNAYASSSCQQAIVPSLQENKQSYYYTDCVSVSDTAIPTWDSTLEKRVDERQEKPKNSLEDMFSRLVNVEDITENPKHLQEASLSMNPISSSSRNGRSGSTSALNWCGPQPTLAEMKEISSSSKPSNGKKEIMSSNFYPVNAPQYGGELVVYGSSTQNPYMQQEGFGVGAVTER